MNVLSKLQPRLSRWIQWGALALLLAAGLAVRLVNLTEPPLDFHPVRQLRSALIARGAYYAMNPNLDPAIRAQAISLTPVDIHEPPIFEQLIALVYTLAGGESLWLARIFAALFWLVGGWALFALAKRHTSFWAALLGLAFYLCLPFGVTASRAFMPDPGMVMWILLAVYAVDRWAEKPTWKWTILAGGLAGMAILWKVVAGFFLAGAFILVVLGVIGWRKLLKTAKPWVMALLALLPAVFYYLVMNSIRATEYFTSNTVEMFGMLFTTKFYAQWLSLVNDLVGLTAVLAALMGIVLAEKRFRIILVGLWLGYIAYGLTWPFQYTTHEYYHLSLVALSGLSLTPLLQVVLARLSLQRKGWRLAAVVVLLFAMGYQLWVGRSIQVASNYRLEPKSWEIVGKAVPVNEPFVALTNDYGLRLAYYGWRMAEFNWPATPDLETALLRGQQKMDTQAFFNQVTADARYFLVTAMGEMETQSELNAILESYPTFITGNGFMVFDLRSQQHK